MKAAEGWLTEGRVGAEQRHTIVSFMLGLTLCCAPHGH